MKKLFLTALLLLVTSLSAWGQGTAHGRVSVNDLLTFLESAGDATCAAGDYWLKGNSSTNTLRGCENGNLFDANTAAGSASWSSLTNPTAATTFVSGALAEIMSYDFQANYTTEQLVLFKTSVGTPSGGTLLTLEVHDDDVLPFAISDGSINVFSVARTGAVTAALLNNVRMVDGIVFTTVQAAHDNCASTGCTIIVPDGDRALSANLTLTKPVRILFGHGVVTMGTNQVLITNDGVEIQGARSFNPGNGTEFTYSGTGVAFDIGDGTNPIFDVTLEGFKLRTTGAAITSATAEGIRTRNGRYIVLEDVAVLDFQQGTCVHWEASGTSFDATNSMVRPQLWQCDVGILSDGVDATTKTNHLTIIGGFVLRGSIAQAGTIGLNFTEFSDGARIISTDVEGYAQGFRVAGDAIKIEARSEDNTTHIDIISTAARTDISSHHFTGSGTFVANAGTFTKRWDVDAPIRVDNSANSGFGHLAFDNQAAIAMEEVGGTERLVLQMSAGDSFIVGTSTNATALRGSTIRVENALEFIETTGDPTCAAGNFGIKANSSTNKLRGCEDGTLFDLNTAGGAGDITDVGPGCDTGACWTDGLATTGTVLLVWEGTGADTNEFTINVPANPGADIGWTIPDSATALTFPTGTTTVAAFSDNLGVFAATTSAEFLGIISNETGTTGLVVASVNPTLTDVTVDDLITFAETAGDATCAAGDYWVKGNSTSNKMRGCENGTAFDLNTAGGGNSFGTIGNAVADSASDTLTVTDSSRIDFTTTNDPEDLTADIVADSVDATYIDETDAYTWTGLHTFVPSGLGGLANFDIQIGDTDGTPTYGIARLGNSFGGRTSFISGSLDLDGAVLWVNQGGPVTSDIEFAWMESSSVVRFAIAGAGTGLGTYSPRSLIIAGPAPADSNMVNCDTWTTDNDNIDCDTGATGADLFVQDDAEIEGTVFAGVLTEGGNAVPNSTDTLDFFAATTSAEFLGVIDNETGTTGLVVASINPTLTDVTIDDLITFTETSGDATCSTGDYWIKGNSTSNTMRGCENGTAFDVNTTAGASSWSSLTAPTGAVTMDSDNNAELAQFNYTSDLGATDVAFQVEQLTGNPVAGSILLELVAADTDILLLSAGSGSNTIDITQAGAMTAEGTASITATLGDSATSFFSSGILESSIGGTGSGFTLFSGPASTEKTFTLPNATSTILTDNAAVTIAQGGTGQTTANPAFNALSPVTTEGDLIYRNATVNARLARGANGECLTASATTILWGSCGAGGNVDLLDGSVHQDTAAASVTRGGIVVGKTATPVWDLLTIGGANTFLGSDATDATWTGLVLAGPQFANQGTTTTLLHGNAAGNPSWAAVSLTADVTGTLPGGSGGTNNAFMDFTGPTTSLKTFTLPDATSTILTDNADVTVAQGGTGLNSGTSGGILGFTGTTTLASSALLVANELVLGGGAGATPATLGSLGTTTTLLHGNAAGAPTFGSVVAADMGAGFVDATTDLAPGLCGANTILERQAAVWACIATPSGGGARWDELTDPTAATTFAGSAVAETLDFDFQANYTTEILANFRTTTGTPSGGVVLNAQTHDSDMTIFRAWDGTNGVEVSGAGVLSALSTGGVDWPALLNYPTGCTNQFVVTIADTLTCDTVTAADTDETTFTDVTWGANADFVWNFNTVGGSNPDSVISFTGANVNVSTGVLQEGGVNVVVDSFTITTGDGISGGGDLTTNRTVAIDLLTADDQTGSSSNQSGMEFGDTGSDMLALLRGCGNGQILKFNTTGGLWECQNDDDSGGAPRWDQLTDPTGAMAMNSGTNTELLEFNYISALGATDVAFQIEQLTGDPVTGSVLLELTASDADILLLSADGFTIDSAGAASGPSFTGTGSNGVIEFPNSAAANAGANVGRLRYESATQRLRASFNTAGYSDIALASDKLDLFASTTSAELATVISDSTGSAGLVFANNPLFPVQVRFTAISPPSYAAGQLFYDSDNESMSFHNNEADVTLQIGQESWLRVRNVTGSTINNGQVVYIVGVDSGLPSIALARADVMATAQAVGIATHSIEDVSNGYVTTFGLVRDFDTSSFTIADRVYLSASTAGLLTNTAPSDPNFVVPIGIVTEVNATTGDVLVTLSPPRPIGGAGIQITGNTISTLSSEEDFLVSGVLSCGANTAGKMQTHTTPLQYCDNDAPPVLQYAAYGASDGDALAGDDADSFFDAGTIGVARGGTNLASGTDGGILGYTATGTLASSALLTANALVLGGGTGATPSTPVGLGTTTTLLHGNAGGAPSYGAVDLANDVTGALASGSYGAASIDSDDVATPLKTFDKSIVIIDPTTGEDDKVQWMHGKAVTYTDVDCSTDAGTVTIDMDHRVITTPNTVGTDILTGTIVCDTDNQADGGFADATIPANVPVNLSITAVSGAGTVRIHIRGSVDP